MVPVEVDQLYRSVKELSDALGPDGANKTDGTGRVGAVSELVATGAANLQGNGENSARPSRTCRRRPPR